MQEYIHLRTDILLIVLRILQLFIINLEFLLIGFFNILFKGLNCLFRIGLRISQALLMLDWYSLLFRDV